MSGRCAMASPQMQRAPQTHYIDRSSYEIPEYCPRPETLSERRQRERHERETLRQQAIEQERQRLKQIQIDYDYVREQWAAFQRTKYGAPPPLLPLEAADEWPSFDVFVTKMAMRTLKWEAVSRFRSEIKSQVTEGHGAVRRLKRRLKNSLLGGLLSFGRLGKIRDWLRKCVFSFSAPELGSPAKEAIAQA